MNPDQRDRESMQLITALICAAIALACLQAWRNPESVRTARQRDETPYKSNTEALKEWPRINEGMTWGGKVTNSPKCEETK